MFSIFEAGESISKIGSSLKSDQHNKIKTLLLFVRRIVVIYRWPSLYAIDRDSKNRLAYNEFAYKKTKDDC